MDDIIASSGNLPTSLLWLADAPMFIDSDQVERFYDAVVRPAGKEGTTTYKVSKQQIDKIRDKVGGKGTFSLGTLLNWIGLPSASVEVTGETEAQQDRSDTEGVDVILNPIDTPQRQLEQLSAHYLLVHPERLFLMDELIPGEWLSPKVIGDVPRALAFLNLPSLTEAEATHIAPTNLIPTAAEFTNGTVATYFDKVKSLDNQTLPPAYPDYGDQNYAGNRKHYWQWFIENFSIARAVDLIENSVKEQEARIQWIDYRVPVGIDGETLHLHIVPAGKYDTGTFAYNFIRRGYEHGLRLVGSLKSDPDLNVLAVYER